MSDAYIVELESGTRFVARRVNDGIIQFEAVCGLDVLYCGQAKWDGCIDLTCDPETCDLGTNSLHLCGYDRAKILTDVVACAYRAVRALLAYYEDCGVLAPGQSEE